MATDTLTSPTPTRDHRYAFSVPCSGADLLRQIDDQRFTGCVLLDGSRIEVYALDGIVYYVDGTAAPSIEDLLLVEQLVTQEDLDAGILKLASGTYVGRLTDRVPHLDADAIRVVVEMAIEDRLTVVAQQQIIDVEIVPMRKHRSGIHRLLGLGRFFTVPFPSANESASPVTEPVVAVVAGPVVAGPVATEAVITPAMPQPVAAAPVAAPPAMPGPEHNDDSVVDASVTAEPIAVMPPFVKSPQVDEFRADTPTDTAPDADEEPSFEFNLDDLLRTLDLDRDELVTAEPVSASASEPSLELRLSCLDHLL